MVRMPVGTLLARAGAPTVAAAVALSLYLLTVAPTIAPLHDNVDSAELVVVAAHLGVAHPPGSAIWMPFGWAALHWLTVIPEPALRTNLLSVALMTGAVATLAVAARRWRAETPGWAATLAGLLGGLAPLVWAQGIVTEVLALQALLSALALVLCVDAAGGRRWTAFALVLGLLVANHPTGLALGLPLGAAALARSRPPRRVWPRIAAACIAPTAYAFTYLLLRADAPIAWGDTGTIAGAWAHLSGSAYQRAIDLSPATVASGVPVSMRVALRQIPPPLWPLMPAGGLMLARARPLLALAAGVTVAVLLVFVAAYGSTGREDYLAPVVFVEAMLAACGAEALWGWLRERLPDRSTARALAVGGVGLVALWAVYVGSQVTLRGETVLRDEARARLAGVARDGEIVADTDQSLFPLWYAQAMLGDRPDVTIRSVHGLPPVLRGGVQVR